MRFVTKQGDRVRRLFEHQRDLMNRIDIKFTSSGMQIRAMDHTQNCLVDINLVASSLEVWELEPGETHRIGMTVERLCRGMRSVANGNVLSWELPNAFAPNEYLIIETESPVIGKGSMRVNLSEPNDDEIEISAEIPFHYAVTMSAPLMQTMCKCVSDMQSDHVIIECNATHLRVGAYGNLMDGFWTLGEAENVSIKPTKEAFENNIVVRSVFALKTLHYIAKAAAAGSSSGETIDIFLHRDLAMVFKYSIGTIGYARYALARDADDHEVAGSSELSPMAAEDEFM